MLKPELLFALLPVLFQQADGAFQRFYSSLIAATGSTLITRRAGM